jgi:hypothetical protein
MKGTNIMTTISERSLEAKLAAIAGHFELGEIQTFEQAPGSNQNYSEHFPVFGAFSTSIFPAKSER